jgi:hypothetical protein
MRTLELKDICGYVPHGLKVLINDEVCDVLLTLGIRANKQNISTNIENGKPILHPISNMYRTIIHKGEKIIPIVECAKRSIHGVEWNNTVHKSKIVEDDYYILSFRDGYKYKFGYNKHGFWMEFENKKYPVIQFPLFDYLNELKIDYRGLIESGLAIDVNTLEINPYK